MASYTGVVTRVVFCDIVDQFLNQIGVIDDFVFATVIRKLILDGVQAVRARRDDFFHAVVIEVLDVGLSHHLREHLVPDTFRAITGAHFFFAQNTEADTRFVQNFHECARYLDIALVVGACTAYVVKVLDV